MRPQLLMGAVGIFIFGTLLACICSGRWLLNGEMDIIRALASFNTSSIQTAGGWAIPKSPITFWNAIVTAFMWKYPFLDYSWAIFVKIPLWIISVGVIWAFIEIALNIAQGLIGAVRGLFT